ncbi:hypothetical protein Tco_1531404 [Tanacetum coccineum]
MTESPFVDSGFAVLVFSPGDDPIACLNKAMAFLTAVAFSRFPFTNNQLRTSSNPRNQATIQDGKVTVQQVQGRQRQNYSGLLIRAMLLVQGEILQVDRQELLNATTTKVKDIWLDNKISSDSNIIPYSQYLQETQQATVQDTNLQAQQDLMILEKLALKEQIDSLEQNLSKQIKEKESLSKTFTVFKNESKEKEDKYRENEIDLENKVKELDNIICKVELSAEQAFWFHILNPSIESSYTPPVTMKVPSELPKVSLVNASLKNLKFYLTQFDYVVKNRNTPNALKEGKWGFEHTKTIFNNEIIPFLKSLKDIFNVFDKDLLNEITEVQTVFDQMDAAVQ